MSAVSLAVPNPFSGLFARTGPIVVHESPRETLQVDWSVAPEDRHLIIKLDGSLTMESLMQGRQRLRKLAARDFAHSTVHVDVKALDIAGLNELLSLREALMRAGNVTRFVGHQAERVNRWFRTCETV